MDELQLLNAYLFVGGLLFAIGLVGMLSRRNMIVMFLSVEMMLQGVALSLVAWGRFHDDWGGQMLAIFIVAVAACEAGIALAMVLVMYQQSGKLDIAAWHALREENQPAYVDREIPEEPRPAPHWPTLAPAGHEPRPREEEDAHRSHV